MDITVGRIVHYTLTADDAAQINRRRTTGKSIADRLKTSIPVGAAVLESGIDKIVAWPAGAQAHIGNDAHEGDVMPMIVVKVWSPTTVNGQAFLDGNDALWVTSATEGTQPHCWQWPPKV